MAQFESLVRPHLARPVTNVMVYRAHPTAKRDAIDGAYRRLAAAIVVQAMLDLGSADPERRQSSRAFLTEDTTWYEDLCQHLDLSPVFEDPDTLLLRARHFARSARRRG